MEGLARRRYTSRRFRAPLGDRHEPFSSRDVGPRRANRKRGVPRNPIRCPNGGVRTSADSGSCAPRTSLLWLILGSYPFSMLGLIRLFLGSLVGAQWELRRALARTDQSVGHYDV